VQFVTVAENLLLINNHYEIWLICLLGLAKPVNLFTLILNHNLAPRVEGEFKLLAAIARADMARPSQLQNWAE
jgi:hypothetical protein